MENLTKREKKSYTVVHALCTSNMRVTLLTKARRLSKSWAGRSWYQQVWCHGPWLCLRTQSGLASDNTYIHTHTHTNSLSLLSLSHTHTQRIRSHSKHSWPSKHAGKNILVHTTVKTYEAVWKVVIMLVFLSRFTPPSCRHFIFHFPQHLKDSVMSMLTRFSVAETAVWQNNLT